MDADIRYTTHRRPPWLNTRFPYVDLVYWPSQWAQSVYNATKQSFTITPSVFSLFNALKIWRNSQDVIGIISNFYISNKGPKVNNFSRTDCLLIGIPIHSHEQDIMVKKEDESYNFQYVILGNRVVWVISSSL